MARYDRIARIDPPHRDDTFDSWLTLRDLDGREREPELGRRARLHFLALRPVRRLLLRGLDGPQASSLGSQLEAVRDQVDRLPPEDSARDRLIHYLEEVGGRSPAGLVRATLDVGAAAEAAGHLYAAEEFYRTALDLAEAHRLHDMKFRGLRDLGRVHRERGEWDDAIAALEMSAALATKADNDVEWARSMEALAAVYLRKGDDGRARSLLDEVLRRGASDPRVRGIGEAGRCALELVAGNPDTAVEAGWAAATSLPAVDEARNRVLLNMAAAFRRLGLGSAATSCYDIVVRWAAWPEHRLEARLERALVAAEGGRSQSFEDGRAAILDDIGQLDRPLAAMMHLGLGRGSMLVGATDQAREHIRTAISTARDLEEADLLVKSEDLLATLDRETHPMHEDEENAAPESVTRIAGELGRMARDLVAATAEA